MTPAAVTLFFMDMEQTSSKETNTDTPTIQHMYYLQFHLYAKKFFLQTPI
jgi:hypothetical protein